jgi:flagellar assembly protein FliH
MTAKSDTPRVLKAHDARSLGAKVAFNFEDLRQRCDAFIAQTKEQARQILTETRAESEVLKKEAFESGREEGRAAGLVDAEDEIEQRARQAAERLASEQLDSLLPAMRAAAEELAVEKERWLAHWEAAAVGVAVKIAEKLILRRLEIDPGAATEMIASALRLAAGSPGMRIRLNPRDAELLGELAGDVTAALAPCTAADVVPDETVRYGGCLIETRHGTLDGRLETMLLRISDELLEQNPRSADPSDGSPL